MTAAAFDPSGASMDIDGGLLITKGAVAAGVATGEDLRRAAAPALACSVDIFAEVEPTQKEQIVTALRRAGHLVGFISDGINDAPALHAADLGISVADAVAVGPAGSAGSAVV